jgi:VCBS repeat protein
MNTSYTAQPTSPLTPRVRTAALAFALAAGLIACDDTAPTSPGGPPIAGGPQAAISASDNHSTITVRRSTGSTFNPNEDWINDPYVYYGTRGTFFADVTGDRAADAIAVNDWGVTVRRSTGGSFGPPQTWISGAYYGSRNTFFADVTGDGLADAIAVNDWGVTVRRAVYNPMLGLGGFDKNETWISGAYYGTRGTFFADVTGDGRADAIVVTDYGVTVRSANRLCQYAPLPTPSACFNPNQDWTHGAYYGDYRLGPSVYFADVTGGNGADAIVINDDLGTIEQP